ncbi:MAG TPA: FAD-dependent oxidoreductase [Terriglobales bacterium]|jgi:glycine oxidase
MPSADAIVIGAGLVGLALARELSRQGLRAEVYDAAAAGRGASWAGAGMLAAYQLTHPALRALGIASARLYPTWIRELELETGLNAGYRPSGSLVITSAARPAPSLMENGTGGWEHLSGDVSALEPGLCPGPGDEVWRVSGDHSIDNRALIAALLASLRDRGVPLHEHTMIESIEAGRDGLGVVARGVRRPAGFVINCAGAWTGQIRAPFTVTVRPRKGQMIALRSTHELRHVIAAPGVYLVPRAGGRILAGATLEDCGFDPEVSEATARGLQQRASALVPALAAAALESTWIGYRPCAPDGLPLLGPTPVPGYWLATAHFRDGILCAPITAKIVSSAMAKGYLTTALDLAPFRPERFTAFTAA